MGNPCGPLPTSNSVGGPRRLARALGLDGLHLALRPPTVPLAIATVVGREDEVGTALVEFDRDLDGILFSRRATAAYAAYRVEQTAGEARRLTKVLQVTENLPSPDHDRCVAVRARDVEQEPLRPEP